MASVPPSRRLRSLGRDLASSARFLGLAAARVLTVAAGAMLLAGCTGSMIEKAPPSARASGASGFSLQVDPVLRGTVASESIVLGYQPVIVRGYGLVVGLAGTGSRDLPPDLRAQMLSEMARRGVGSAQTGFADIDPERMLNSLDTAVVIVEAVLPPASVGPVKTADGRMLVDGTRFDVRVLADPRTGTTSLEGGRLYTTELRPGPLSTGRAQARALAIASGPIFLNPFVEPGAVGRDTVDRRVGRILNGGMSIDDLPLKLRLASPSHARAEILQSSINARFPKEPGQRDDVARGESDSSITITVPPSYRDDTQEFVNLLRHTTIRLSEVERVAESVRRVVLADPSVDEQASWRWRALGQRALPVIQNLYDYPELKPRLAALRAGAWLDDAITVPHLLAIATGDDEPSRLIAIELLGSMQMNPRINFGLRELLDDESVDVRLAAYEALADRGDPAIMRVPVDDRFVLDVVESEKPLIYITQYGMPRIVVFGEELSLDVPITFNTWSDRLLVKADPGAEQVEVYYLDEATGRRIIQDTDPNLASFTAFLAHEPSVDDPETGLGMTYGQTVGALHALWRDRKIDADFKADQDRILAQIMSLAEEENIEDRPEFEDPDFDYLRPDDGMRDALRLDFDREPGEAAGDSELESLRPAVPQDRP